MRAYSKNHRVRPPVDKSMIVFVARGLSEPDAHAEEKRLIAQYGRIDNGTGCLRNLTDGGEGQCGAICSPNTREKLSRKRHSQEFKDWLSSINLGKNHSDEAKAKMRGRKISEEAKSKISATRKMRGFGPSFGHPVSAETRAKLSAANTDRKRSEETIAQMRKRRNSDEVRARISATIKSMWESGRYDARQKAVA